MDLQEYIRSEIRGKSVVLVGNARFGVDRSAFIDSHEIVFRFNLFAGQGYSEELCGKKTTHWCNNLVREWQHREGRPRHWELLQSLTPPPTVLTPSAEDKHKRLKTWIPLYERMGVSLLYPDSDLAVPPGSTSKEPSVGFYTAIRLLDEHIPFDVIAFNGGVSNRHDGDAEMRFLHGHPLVTVDTDF